MCRMAGTSKWNYDFSSYAFNGVNLLTTNYPNFAYNGFCPVSAAENSVRLKIPPKQFWLRKHRPSCPIHGISRNHQRPAVCRCSTMREIWSVSWTATSATSRFIGTARFAIPTGAFRSQLITIHPQDTITNGVEIRATVIACKSFSLCTYSFASL